MSVLVQPTVGECMPFRFKFSTALACTILTLKYQAISWRVAAHQAGCSAPITLYLRSACRCWRWRSSSSRCVHSTVETTATVKSC